MWVLLTLLLVGAVVVWLQYASEFSGSDASTSQDVAADPRKPVERLAGSPGEPS